MSLKPYWIVCRTRGGGYYHSQSNVFDIEEEAEEAAAILARRFPSESVTVFQAVTKYAVEKGELTLTEYGG